MEEEKQICEDCGQEECLKNIPTCGYCHIHRIDACVQFRELVEKGFLTKEGKIIK